MVFKVEVLVNSSIKIKLKTKTAFLAAFAALNTVIPVSFVGKH
jgi:hypothetical protein